MPDNTPAPDPKKDLQYRCTRHTLVWPAEATVTAGLVERHGGDVAALVADGSLRPWGEGHPAAPKG